MHRIYLDSFQWKDWPVTIGVTASGLKWLEFRTLAEVMENETRIDPSLKLLRDPQATDSYMKQIREYFLGERRVFELPLDRQGTDFQLRVWRFLQSIPYGKVASYQQAAEASGNRKAVRAAGMANNRNPISVVVPCHRIVGKDGALVGYGGGLLLKEALLRLEGVNVSRGRILEETSWMNRL